MDKDITVILQMLGTVAKTNNIRLSSHPDQFVVLNSPNEELTGRSIRELEYHNKIFENMGLDFSHGTVINIHGGGKVNGLDQLITNSKLLSDSCKSKLTIENDEFSYGIDESFKQ